MQDQTNLPTNSRGTTVADVAQFAGLSLPTIYKAIKCGDLQAKKVGKRTVILPEWVDQWINSLPDTKDALV